MRNVWEVGIHAKESDSEPCMIVHVECDNEVEALTRVSEEFNLGGKEAIVSRGKTDIDDKAPYLQRSKPAGYGSNSAAVGLVGGAALGAAVGGPVWAIVGGVVGTILGKEYKGVG